MQNSVDQTYPTGSAMVANG